jgi:hypothetical protein
MNYFILILSVILLQQIPYKPKEEFEIKLDYQFKQRPLADLNSVQLGGKQGDYHRRTTGVLPYLVLNIKVLKLSEEKMRVRISKNINDRPIHKKVNIKSVIELDLGFTDDMKDRVKAHEYTVSFISSDKKTMNQILISIGEDGSFFVNGEKRGKF